MAQLGQGLEYPLPGVIGRIRVVARGAVFAQEAMLGLGVIGQFMPYTCLPEAAAQALPLVRGDQEVLSADESDQQRTVLGEGRGARRAGVSAAVGWTSRSTRS